MQRTATNQAVIQRQVFLDIWRAAVVRQIGHARRTGGRNLGEEARVMPDTSLVHLPLHRANARRRQSGDHADAIPAAKPALPLSSESPVRESLAVRPDGRAVQRSYRTRWRS